MEKTEVAAAKKALEEAVVAQMSAMGKAAKAAVDMAVRELAMAQVVKCAQCDDGAYCAACAELLRQTTVAEMNEAVMAVNMKMKDEVVVPRRSVRMEVVPPAADSKPVMVAATRRSVRIAAQRLRKLRGY